MRNRIALAAPILLALLFAAAAYAAEITGTWVGKTEVPGQGTDQVTMVLKKTSTGAYAGSITDSLAQIAPDTQIKNISWTNNVLTCSFPLADGSNVKMTVQLGEGKLSGDWVHEQGDSGAIVFERK